MKEKNIILTGIMGCGKTTIGRELAKELKMDFLDLDQYVENKWGSIKELFKHGEKHFRDIESQAVLEVCEMKGLVVATGGGVVKREENISALKRNSIIFFIDRSIKKILSDIDISERPLIADRKEKLIEIYEERYPLYLSTCDLQIKNDDSIHKAIENIKKHITPSNLSPQHDPADKEKQKL